VDSLWSGFSLGKSSAPGSFRAKFGCGHHWAAAKEHFSGGILVLKKQQIPALESGNAGI
jgi:hypothetical protein